MKKTADDFLMKYGIPSDTTIGIEGDHKLTDLLEEYRSQASELPSDDGIGIIRKIEIHIDTTEECIDNFGLPQYVEELLTDDIKLYREAITHLASHVARIKELEEALKISEEIVSELNRGYNRFM